MIWNAIRVWHAKTHFHHVGSKYFDATDLVEFDIWWNLAAWQRIWYLVAFLIWRHLLFYSCVVNLLFYSCVVNSTILYIWQRIVYLDVFGIWNTPAEVKISEGVLAAFSVLSEAINIGPNIGSCRDPISQYRVAIIGYQISPLSDNEPPQGCSTKQALETLQYQPT